MFNRMVVLNHGLPFEAKIPNDETIEAMKEALAGKNLEEITLDDLKAERNVS